MAWNVDIYWSKVYLPKETVTSELVFRTKWKALEGRHVQVDVLDSIVQCINNKLGFKMDTSSDESPKVNESRSKVVGV